MQTNIFSNPPLIGKFSGLPVPQNVHDLKELLYDFNAAYVSKWRFTDWGSRFGYFGRTYTLEYYGHRICKINSLVLCRVVELDVIDEFGAYSLFPILK